MAFWIPIIDYINDYLKNGSLNKSVLKPQQLYGLATMIVRKKDASKATEQLPGIISANGNDVIITPDDKFAVQVYHRIDGAVYDFDKKGGVGDYYLNFDRGDLIMVVIINTERTGVTKEVIEPLFRFGMPQSLTPALTNTLQLRTCRIKAVSADFKHVDIFKREWPQANYFLNEHLTIFTIRYTIATTYLSKCVNLDNIVAADIV